MPTKTKKTREERLTLKEGRDKQFDKFRRNLRILRASLDISAVELSENIKLKNGKRCIDLEYGRGTPTTEELFAISQSVYQVRRSVTAHNGFA